MPRPLTYLGTISYSVYLTHAGVIHALPAVPRPVLPIGVWAATTLAVSAVTYRFVELPAQKLGRRLARRAVAGQVAVAVARSGG